MEVNYSDFFKKAVHTLNNLEKIDDSVNQVMSSYIFWKYARKRKNGRSQNRVRLADYLDGTYLFRGRVSNVGSFKNGDSRLLVCDVEVYGKVKQIRNNQVEFYTPLKNMIVSDHLWIDYKNLELPEGRVISIGDTIEMASKVLSYKTFDEERNMLVGKHTLGETLVIFSGYLGSNGKTEYSYRGKYWILRTHKGRRQTNVRHVNYRLGAEYFVTSVIIGMANIPEIVDLMCEMRFKGIMSKRNRQKAENLIRESAYLISPEILERMLFEK